MIKNIWEDQKGFGAMYHDDLDFTQIWSFNFFRAQLHIGRPATFFAICVLLGGPNHINGLLLLVVLTVNGIVNHQLTCT